MQQLCDLVHANVAAKDKEAEAKFYEASGVQRGRKRAAPKLTIEEQRRRERATKKARQYATAPTAKSDRPEVMVALKLAPEPV